MINICKNKNKIFYTPHIRNQVLLGAKCIVIFFETSTIRSCEFEIVFLFQLLINSFINFTYTLSDIFVSLPGLDVESQTLGSRIVSMSSSTAQQQSTHHHRYVKSLFRFSGRLSDVTDIKINDLISFGLIRLIQYSFPRL